MTGLLTSYLIVFKYTVTKKPIDWISFIFKRYFRVMLPFIFAAYVQYVIIDLLQYPTLLDNKYKLVGGTNDLNLNYLLLYFLVYPNFYFKRSQPDVPIRIIGMWYICEDFKFCLITPFVIMLYLKSPKAFYIGALLTLATYQAYAFITRYSEPLTVISSKKFEIRKCRVQNF